MGGNLLAEDPCNPNTIEEESENSREPPPEILSLEVSKDLQSVQDVWKEYTLGWDGKPAIRTVEQKYGNAWRKPARKRKFFSMRMHIVKEIERNAQEKKITCDASAADLDLRYRAPLGSLNKYYLALQKRETEKKKKTQ